MSALARLLDQADAGPWWYDGRDIFHKKPGTNLDQIIIPIPDKHETFHPSQAVLDETARLAALAPDMARLLLDAMALVRRLDADIRGEGYSQDDPEVEALLARFAELEQRAAP